VCPNLYLDSACVCKTSVPLSNRICDKLSYCTAGFHIERSIGGRNPGKILKYYSIVFYDRCIDVTQAQTESGTEVLQTQAESKYKFGHTTLVQVFMILNESAHAFVNERQNKQKTIVTSCNSVNFNSIPVICFRFVFISMLDKLITYVVCWVLFMSHPKDGLVVNLYILHNRQTPLQAEEALGPISIHRVSRGVIYIYI
jgi:hypothetical protein